MTDSEFVELIGVSSLSIDEALKSALGSVKNKVVQGYEVIETSSSAEPSDERSYQVKLKARVLESA
jgi:flavin-binding protein dodecin